jgi:hypothetical protein
VIDLDHPDAPKLVNSVLKALEALTRAATSGERTFGNDGIEPKKVTGERIEEGELAANILAEAETRVETGAQPQARDETMRDSVLQDVSVPEGGAPALTGSTESNREEQMEHDMRLDRDAVEEVQEFLNIYFYA